MNRKKKINFKLTFTDCQIIIVSSSTNFQILKFELETWMLSLKNMKFIYVLLKIKINPERVKTG